MLHDDDNDADNGDDEQCCANKQNMETSWKIRGKFQKGHGKSWKIHGNFNGIYGNSMEKSRKFYGNLWKLYGKFWKIP